MKHFVLIHGICHGAWCWYKVVPLLKSAGHRVTALDLGASGINPKKITQLASLSDYVEPLMEFMASLPQDDKVILVGHSYGGIVISLAMESFPIKVVAAVYLTAIMPNHEPPLATALAEHEKAASTEPLLDLELSSDDDGSTIMYFGPKYTEAKLYQLSPKEDIELAKTLLRRANLFMKDLSKQSPLTKEKFGSIDRVYIVCKDDLEFKESMQMSFIENNPTADVKFIAGADHMAMFSKPQEVCKCLQEVAEKYN